VYRTLLLGLLLLACKASAQEQPSVSPNSIDTDRDSVVLELKGGKYELPAGYFFTRRAFTVSDTELRRLQDAETRLKAENGELREQVKNSTSPLVPIITTAIGLISTGVILWFANERSR